MPPATQSTIFWISKAVKVAPVFGIGKLPLHANIPVEVTFILSIKTLLVRRGSPRITRFFGEQPMLVIPMTPVVLLIAPSRKSSQSGLEPTWQVTHRFAKKSCIPLARVTFLLATPNTDVAGVPDAFCSENIT